MNLQETDEFLKENWYILHNQFTQWEWERHEDKRYIHYKIQEIVES